MNYTKQDGGLTYGIALAGALLLSLMLGFLPNTVWGAVVTSVVLNLLWVICVLTGSRRIGYKNIMEKTHAKTKLSALNILLLVAIGVAGVWFLNPLAEVFIDLFKLIGYVPPQGNALLLGMNNFGLFALALLVACVIPAIFEEFLFRGVILQAFRDLGKVKSVLLSGFLFALFHLSPAQTVFQFYLGCVCALAVIKTGSIWAGVIVHFVNNAFIVAYTYLSNYAVLTFVWWEIALMALIGAALVWVFFRQLKSKNKLEFKQTKKINILEDGVLFFVVFCAIVIWVSLLGGF